MSLLAAAAPVLMKGQKYTAHDLALLHGEQYEPPANPHGADIANR